MIMQAHLFPGCYRDSRLVGSSSHRTGAGDRETHRRGQQRNHVLVSEAVHGSAKWKRGLILRHFSVRVVRRCSHLLLV